MDSSKNDKKIRYSDVVGIRITDEDGNSSFVPYNVAKNSGLVSSGQDLATMQGPRYAFKDFSGAYTNDPSNAALSASITMDDNGKITVTIPEEWQDDEEIKKYTDSYMIDTLSKNYKSDENVKYQDPYDETKQVTTEEYLKELNDALKFKVTALAATNPTKAEVASRYGGTDTKNRAIDNMTVDDIIIMSAKFDEDDSWVPMPAYMLLAYPELKTLESYTNGWVKKKDFLDNFYNIESGKITEANAYGIVTTPEKMLSEIEDMSPEEIAKTIAFGNFISQVDPKRSNWQQFLQAGDALSRGFYGGFYDWFIGTTDLVANIGNLSLIKGESIDTRDFWNGLIANISSAGANLSSGDSYNFTDDKYGFDATAYMGKSMQDMAYTNKDALSKSQAGYVQGRLAGQAVDLVVSMIAVGEATKALSNAITARITGKGARYLSAEMKASEMYQSGATGAATEAQARAAFLADVNAQNAAVAKVANGSAAYKAFFSQTWNEALNLYSKFFEGTTLTLQSMAPAHLANIVNAASRIATTANFANTAINILGTTIIAAVVGNKELTTKVLSSKATTDETKTLVQKVMWDTAKITAFSYVTNIAADRFSGWLKNTKQGQALNEFGQKASQKVTSFTRKIEHPWLTFIQWYANNRAAAGKVSNAGATRAEAIKEAVLANEARAYGVNLSTEPGSYGMKIVQEALAESGVRPGVTMSETLDKLAKAGIVLDPANLNLSEYQAWQANYVGLRNALTNWDDVQSAISQVVHEFSSPDIYPTISQQMSEMNKANGELLEVEQAEGLLSKAEIKKNKGYLRQDEGYIYAMHSPELSRYIVRGYELKVVANEGRRLGHEDLNEYEPYKEALTRFQKASEPLSERLRKIADEQYVPALTKAESNILDVMVDAGVYPKAFVEAMRSSGKFGVNGQDWLRLVARKKTPEGAYTPFSRTVKEDNTISINRFRILEDEDITWPGNGLQQLIEEYGVARAEKDLVREGKKATGKTTEVVVSGEKTRSAGLMKEYKGGFEKAVKQSVKSFVQTVGQTVAIGKKRSAEQIEFVNDIATTGGVITIDIDALRSIMRDKNIPMADSIVDQETLDKFLEESSEETKKLFIEAVGEKMGVTEITEEAFPELIGNETVQKILRGELEKTSLQTGYGIKDTRARLNAQVPGFDVLDWSLLSREHVNGLMSGGFYHGKDNNYVRAYIIDLKDLRKITGLDRNTEDMSEDAINRITKDINLNGGGAILPIEFDTVSGDRRFYPMTRGEYSKFPDWETYFNYLESLGVTKVPVAIDFSKKALAHEAILGSFLDKIDKAIATGKKPDVTIEEVAVALREFRDRDRVIKRLRDSAPEEEYSWKDIRKIVEDAERYNTEVAAGSINEEFDDSLISDQAKERLKIQNLFNDVNAKDVTSDVQEAFSEYGKIPFFHGQKKPLGAIEYNDPNKVPEDIYIGAGDAYWLSPNASYVNSYGPNKLAGTIPVKSFMSDMEKESILDKLFARSEELYDKKNSGTKLTKSEQKEFDSIHKITGAPSGSGRERINSYRALAEYAGKPVIDISEDGFADGTAFFYYKGIDPKFDEEIGKQLEAQAMASNYQLTPTSSKEFVKWAKNTTVKDVLSLIDYKYESSSSDVMKLEKIFEDADKLKGAEKKKFIDSKKEDIAKIDESLGRNLTKDAIEWDEDSMITDSFTKIWSDILGWINSNINKPSVYNNSILNKKIFNVGIDSEWLESAMNDAGYSPLQAFEIRDPAVTEEKIAEWNAIDPRNVENVPTEPEFKQPRTVTYKDYQRGLAEDADLDETLLRALQNEQYNKLSELKEKNPNEYEALLEKADRANAMENDAVRQSGEVQVAADEYRNNIKNFENQVIFNQKFSYIIRTTAETNTFKAFASENNIELGDGKGSVKSKLKSVLWNKVINNEDLPEIKGLKKSKIKNIRELISALGGAENKTAEDVAIDDLVKQFKKEFYSMLDETPLFQNAGGPNPLKYELDEEKLYTDIEDAVGNMMERIRNDSDASAAIDGIVVNQGYKMSTPRFEFTVLSEILSEGYRKDLLPIIKDLARKIVNASIPKSGVVIKGNVDSLYKNVETAIEDKLESRFAAAKTTLESMGEEAESATITELLTKYNSEIKGAEEDPLVIKTMDSNGEIQYERVSPSLASIYNERPTYSPMSTPMKVLNNLAILKKINTTDLSPRSFAKQSFSDPAMAFATVGGLPGTLHAIRDEIAYHFGPDLLRVLEKSDPIRFENIKAISERESISMEEAFKRNSEALAKAKVPFTLLNSELLRQANISKFGNEGALKVSRKNLNEKINGALRRASDLLGTPQNKRETYVRLYAGEKAYLEALRKGYNQDQAEMFREHALNTATTNFRTKHAVFNVFRSTVPYLTSGLSGAKSFWQMFELDPIGVTSRIVTGFIIPIIYFAGEIFSDENLKKKYEALAESEKENHIVMSIGGELVLIPVGEEIGKYTNVVTHAVEILYNENKYSFWSLMLNDLVSFVPGVDLTGFTDPEILEPLAEESPSFLEVMDNGIAKVLAGVAPPIAQSMILGFTGRDLYTGRKIDTSYITIDEEGNPITMSSSTSEFAKALAQVVGGDAKVIERAVSGTVGIVGIHVLDAITSAVQFVGSGGEDGSLTTAVDKTLSDLSSPFTAKYYSGLERRFNYAVSDLFRRKKEIEKDEKYIKYNQEISNEKDSKKRQNLINKRNELFSDYMKKVEALIKGYKAAGGSLDKWKLSKVTSLISFEDAVRADRQFMDLNTNYQDARKQAMQTLYNMGITNPEGPSSLGYTYTDNDGKPQLKMWTPVQMQIIQNSFYEQGNIHTARIKAIIDDGSEDSLYNQKKLESEAEQPYWDKYNSTGKLSNDEWDAIDDLRKVYNAKVVLGLQGYMDTYGAAAVLNNDAVIDYLNDVIKVPSSYEKVKGRYVSSDNGKLNKQTGFAESYIKTIFGVK